MFALNLGMNMHSSALGAAVEHGPAEANSNIAPSYDPDTLDSLHCLPLALIPLETPALAKTLFVKNARLASMVEIFQGDDTGSGQIEPGRLTGYFGNPEGALDRDMVLLRRLAKIGSFDVYTLRLSLRQLDVGFDSYDSLKLSEDKQQELGRYMQHFTRPLIRRIYGQGEESAICDLSDIMSQLSGPDRNKVVGQLQAMADCLNIEITTVPKFLEDYGDMFLSVSYFRQCLESVAADLDKFIPWVDELSTSSAVETAPNTKSQLVEITRRFARLTVSVNERFAAFDKESKKFWTNLNADSFKRLQAFITGEHVFLGTVLCSMVVKLDMWKFRFPNGAGGPMKRLDFIKSEIVPGLERISTVIGE